MRKGERKRGRERALRQNENGNGVLTFERLLPRGNMGEWTYMQIFFPN